MQLPSVYGLIRRRILVNYRVDPKIIERQLPSRLRPKLHNGYAIAGICLIRLEKLRPSFVPNLFGFSSENAAHRVAVTWEDSAGPLEGVYIARRDTASRLNRLAGGRLFPGEHYRASFRVRKQQDRIHLQVYSADRLIKVELSAVPSTEFPTDSCFSSLDEASGFFQAGALGYSVTANGEKLHGVVLNTEDWKVEPLKIDKLYSSYFDDSEIFPAGSAVFDCAFIMRNIRSEWHSAKDMYL